MQTKISENTLLHLLLNTMKRAPQSLFPLNRQGSTPAPPKNSKIQVFRERLPYKLETAYATMSKVIMGNSGFYGCLTEPRGASARWKVTAQSQVFVLSRSLFLNHLKPRSSKTWR